MSTQSTPSKLTNWIRKSFRSRSRSRSPRSKKNLTKAMDLNNVGNYSNQQNCGPACMAKSADDSVNKPYKMAVGLAKNSSGFRPRSLSRTRGTSTERAKTSEHLNSKDIVNNNVKDLHSSSGTNNQRSPFEPNQNQTTTKHANLTKPNYHRPRHSPSPTPEGRAKMGHLNYIKAGTCDKMDNVNEWNRQNSKYCTENSKRDSGFGSGTQVTEVTDSVAVKTDSQSTCTKLTARLGSVAQVLPNRPQHPKLPTIQRHSNVARDSSAPAELMVAMETAVPSDVDRRSTNTSTPKMHLTDTHTTQIHADRQHTRLSYRQSRSQTMGQPQRTAACSPDSAVHSPGSTVTSPDSTLNSLHSPGLDSDTSYAASDSRAFQDVQKKMARIKSDLKRPFFSTDQGIHLMDIKDTYGEIKGSEKVISGSSINSRSTTPLVQDCFTKQQIYNAYKMHKTEGQQETNIELCPKQQLESLQNFDMYSHPDTSDTEIRGYFRPSSRSSQGSQRRSKSAGSRSRSRRQQSVSPHRRSASQERCSIASSAQDRCSIASSNSGSRRSLRIAKTELLNERNARKSRSQQSLMILRDLPGFVPKRSESRASTLSVMETKLNELNDDDRDHYDDDDEGCSSDSSLSYASTCSSEDEFDYQDYDDIESGFHPVIHRLQKPVHRSQSSLSQYSINTDVSYHRYPTPIEPPPHQVCEIHGAPKHPLSPALSPIGPVIPRTPLSPGPNGPKGTKDFLMDRWWSTLKDVTNMAQQGSRAYEDEDDVDEDDDSTCKNDHDSDPDVSMATTASYIPGVTLADKLRLAASKGQMDKVKELIMNGATFEPDREGRTALHYAALNGYAEVVQLLAVEGSSIDSQDNLGYTALHRAAAQGHLDVIKVLLAEGCMIDRQDEVHHNTALHEAAWNGLSKSLEFLIKNNADVNIVNKAGFSALHLCCQNGHNQSARVLLYGGANTSMKNNYGDTPLHTAARYGHAGVTRILLSAKCDGNEQNKNGDTSLHICAALKRRKIAKLLVDSFVNVNVKNKQNEAAIDVARRKDHPEIIEIILSQPKPPKNKKTKKSKTDGEKKDKKGFLFWKKKEKEKDKAAEAAQYAVPPKSQGIPSIAPSIAAPSEISSCRHLDQFPGYKQSMQSIPSQVKASKTTTRGVGITAGSQLSLASKQGYLNQYTAHDGVQYYRDLAGNVKQGPVGFAPVCNCGPLIKRLEQKVDADKANFYDHVDATRRMLTDRMKTVAQSLEEASEDRVQNEKRDRDEAIHRRAVKDRMELERQLDRQHNALRSEMKDYVDARLNNIVSQDDCCNWHHSACKNYHGMRRAPRESTPKTNLYRSKSDETLSSLGLSNTDTHRVSRTQAQAMRELRKKSKLKENREPQSHRMQGYPPRDTYKHGRSPEGSSSHGEMEEEQFIMPSWAKQDVPYNNRPYRQPMVSPLASVPEGSSNNFSDSSLQPHQITDVTDDSLVAPFSSPVYPSMEIVPNNMKVYHSKTDSGSNPDSGYSNSSRGARQHQVMDDQHNTSSVTNESCTTEGSGSSLRSSMSADKSGEQALPSSRQYFNTVSNQMEMWYERRLREMEKTTDDHTKQQSDAMHSHMKHIEERIAINRLRMNPSLESTTGTEV